MRILIVDDSTEDRTILRHYLNQFGDEILEATDGAEGLALATSERPDLIISDAMMPNMDGFELLREVRRSEKLGGIPFIFYSAVYTGCRGEEFAMSLGADAFLVKPLDSEEFLKQLKSLLEGLDRTKKRPVRELLEEDEKYLRKYSQVVAARLEEKVRELELANSKLAASENSYRNLYNSIRDIIIVADESRIIMDANQPALRDFFGYETKEVVGKRTDFLYASNEAFEKTGKEILELQNTSKGKMIEVAFRRKNGEQFTGELFAMKLVDDNGEPIGNIGVIRDVTEQRKVEAQLRQSQKMESIGTLAGGIAHDFNNILTAIIGYGQLTLVKMAADYPLRHNVAHMLEAADMAAHLTKELLLFSRKQGIEKKPVDLNVVVAKVEKFLKKVIGEDISCQTILHKNQIMVLADGYQLEQVMMNLATNARDSMLHGGTFAVTTGIANMNEEYALTYGLGMPGPYALITVSDSGEGMDEETQKRIFEPFYTTKEVGKGTGLGLAVAYGIIRQHNGCINVYSEPGHGTTFRIYLPLSASEAGEDVQPCEEEATPRGTETILLAEDNDLVRDLVETVLTESGYTVIVAVDGEEAVQKFREHAGSIQLLLLDLIMPKMNGKAVSDEIHKLQPGLKTLFASGYAPDIIQNKASLGPDAHLIHKPIVPQELLKKVRDVLAGVS